MKIEYFLYGTQQRISSATLSDGPLSLFLTDKTINRAQDYKCLCCANRCNLFISNNTWISHLSRFPKESVSLEEGLVVRIFPRPSLISAFYAEKASLAEKHLLLYYLPNHLLDKKVKRNFPKYKTSLLVRALLPFKWATCRVLDMSRAFLRFCCKFSNKTIFYTYQ